jgi:hypothetical protein
MAATTDDIVNILNEQLRLQREQMRKTSAQTGGAAERPGYGKKLADALYEDTLTVIDASKGLSRTLGTTFSRAIQLEFEARAESVDQLRRYGADFAATTEDIRTTMMAASDAFVNVPRGLGLSEEASAEYASRLKTIFGADIVPTSDMLRNFGILGLDSAEKLQAFKDSTGRAALSTTQLSSLLNNNQASLLIFGNSVSKAAIDMEQIGLSLEQYRSVQQGAVTNLESTLDTINQLNQLGANIDFETFIRLSELGTPDETFKYLDQVIPDALLKTSTSFRALTETLSGVRAADLLRGRPERLEQQFLESFTGPSANALYYAIATGAAAAAAAMDQPGAREAVTIAKEAAQALAGKAPIPVPDGIVGAAPSGFGDRTLVTPNGNIAFDNNDTILAGTEIFPRGTFQMGNNGDTSVLASKIDNLINTLASATTTVNVDGRLQTVNRIQLAEVNTRFQRA